VWPGTLKQVLTLLVRPGTTEVRLQAGCSRCSYDRVLPKSLLGTTKHTGGSRTHAHEHRSQWREESLATRPGSRGRGARRSGGGDTEGVRGRTLFLVVYNLPL
jgi:hypothetical protein